MKYMCIDIMKSNSKRISRMSTVTQKELVECGKKGKECIHNTCFMKRERGQNKVLWDIE